MNNPTIDEIKIMIAKAPTPATLAVRRSRSSDSGHNGFRWGPIGRITYPANGYRADPYTCGAGLYGYACDDRAGRMTHPADGSHWTIFLALPSEDGRPMTDHGNKISCGAALPLYRGDRQSAIRVVRALGGTPPAALSPVRPAYLARETGREPHDRSRPYDGIEAIGWIVAATAHARGDLIDRLTRAGWPKEIEVLAVAGSIGLGTLGIVPTWSPIPELDLSANVRWHLWGGRQGTPSAAYMAARRWQRSYYKGPGVYAAQLACAIAQGWGTSQADPMVRWLGKAEVPPGLMDYAHEDHAPHHPTVIGPEGQVLGYTTTERVNRWLANGKARKISEAGRKRLVSAHEAKIEREREAAAKVTNRANKIAAKITKRAEDLRKRTERTISAMFRGARFAIAGRNPSWGRYSHWIVTCTLPDGRVGTCKTYSGDLNDRDKIGAYAAARASRA